MKPKAIFFVMIMLIIPHHAYAKWQVKFDAKANRVMHMGGNTLRGNFATKTQCQAYQRSRPAFERNHSKCVSSGSSFSSTGSNSDIQMMMIQSILQPLFDNLFVPPDTSTQDEVARQNVIKQQQEELKQRTAALQAWTDLQNKENLQRKMEQEAKIKQGENMLSRMHRAGSSAKLEAFSFGNPKLELKPVSQDTYTNTHLTAWERLVCSAYFSNMAKKSTKGVDARFYSDQAQMVTMGEPTYLECKIPKVSNEKLAKMEEINKLYDVMNVKIKDLQDIEYEISESKEKIEKAKSKKEKVIIQINELKTRAATAKPEEKDEVDDLAAMAQELLQDAEQELNQAKQSEKDALNKKEQLENELGNMKAQIQAGSD